jgi:hypothetical protein
MTKQGLDFLIDQEVTTNGNNEISGEKLNEILKELNVAGKIKKIWAGIFTQTTPGATPVVETLVQEGVELLECVRGTAGGGTVVMFYLNFSESSNWNTSNFSVLEGNGRLSETSETPGYVRTLSKVTILNNTTVILRAFAVNDLSGNTKDFNNSEPLKIVLVEFE